MFSTFYNNFDAKLLFLKAALMLLLRIWLKHEILIEFIFKFSIAFIFDVAESATNIKSLYLLSLILHFWKTCLISLIIFSNLLLLTSIMSKNIVLISKFSSKKTEEIAINF